MLSVITPWFERLAALLVSIRGRGAEHLAPLSASTGKARERARLRLARLSDRGRPVARRLRRRLLRGQVALRKSVRRAGAAAVPSYDDDNDQAPFQTGTGMFRAGLVIVILSLISGLLTYLVLAGFTAIQPTRDVTVIVWLINGVLVTAMIAIIAYQVIGLWAARKRQAAGAGLHVRIVSLFSLVALFPAILLAVFASISLDRGLDQWFSERTKSIIRESVNVAKAYLSEHGKILGADAVGIARDLENAAQLMQDNPEDFQRYGAALVVERGLNYAYLINGAGRPVVELIKDPRAPFYPPPPEALARASNGRIAGLSDLERIVAIKKLGGFDDLYLYVLRPVDPTVIGHLTRTDNNVKEYAALAQGRTGLQIAFAMMYVVIALTLLLAAIWIGLWFANRLVTPIRRLIGAAQEVSRGDLNVTVKVESPRSDMGQLGATFNRMTTDLRSQRNALIDANIKLDERRRFTETVLAGVTAGVMGVDAHGVVTLVNSSALKLLGRSEAELIGRPIEDAVPEFAAIVAKVPGHTRRAVQAQITYRRAGSDLTFSVRVTQEGSGKKNYGFVVTVDDITELVVAQRTSAWAEVAQRIAHEIKNPLTPIQLSAERIRRKYGDSIKVDREIFDRCTDTIIRHVGDIGRMVDEFSSFARMPKPVFEEHDAPAIVKEAVILFQMSNSEVEYRMELPEKPLKIDCDRRLITQAVTNLVKNAGEAIATARQSGQKGENYHGRIIARVVEHGTRCIIEVEDNGCGLPSENRHRLTEPYVTTRQKGTGLGLAIVQRIAEQHEGLLELDDAHDETGAVTGAIVRMVIPIRRAIEAGEITDVPDMRGDAFAEEQSKLRQAGGKQGVSYGV
ncbi:MULTISPECIES: PAS domain-containing sensor histidine kinase [Rhodomicrobium]|uniref:sensor histidine kinase NtrY-like n=1 Tax=Rhodomicrobium TaxID=1068 RepID=UPI001483290B|nr:MULTISPECIES: PAS domain-containing sensor histidine kinase [Rhodomicrobium]